METILVVDDEKNYTLVMATLLADEGYEVVTAESAVDALHLIREGDLELDLVLTDMTMPKMDGIQMLGHLKESCPDLPVIMMTAYGTVEKAVEAMKKGAFDYITKPFKNEDLMRTIRRALEMGRLLRANRKLVEALKERYSFGNIIGKSKPMMEIYRMIEKVAASKANILVTGESGTGKELIAKAIHYHSPRSQGPFVPVNCSALADTLLESELLGHEKGAFTDAHAMRKGRFELAHGGTIFLDEIGEMAPNLQAKILRVLQERKFERVGGTTTVEVDVRVIAATNRELKEEVAAGRFREDLFYRLNVVNITMPPLRERSDDLPLLIAHFIKKYGNEAEGRSEVKVDPEALRRMYAYSWPGNVRELENVIERAVILSSSGNIMPEDLPDEFSRQQAVPVGNREIDLDELVPPGGSLNESLETIEKRLIERALSRTDNVQAHAAELLGIKKNVMQYKMKKHGLL
jgi:two-component system NtrC family response regulator